MEKANRVSSLVNEPPVLGELPEAVGGVCDITELYVEKHGVPMPGWRIFIQKVQQIGGWEDKPALLSADISESDGQPGYRRVRGGLEEG